VTGDVNAQGDGRIGHSGHPFVILNEVKNPPRFKKHSKVESNIKGPLYHSERSEESIWNTKETLRLCLRVTGDVNAQGDGRIGHSGHPFVILNEVKNPPRFKRHSKVESNIKGPLYHRAFAN
jgi:hypothetical protein